MDELVFDDEYGRHWHKLLTGPPYDPKADLLCPGCQTKIKSLRNALCEKYGWNAWPADCSVVNVNA